MFTSMGTQNTDCKRHRFGDGMNQGARRGSGSQKRIGTTEQHCHHAREQQVDHSDMQKTAHDTHGKVQVIGQACKYDVRRWVGEGMGEVRVRYRHAPCDQILGEMSSWV